MVSRMDPCGTISRGVIGETIGPSWHVNWVNTNQRSGLCGSCDKGEVVGSEHGTTRGTCMPVAFVDQSQVTSRALLS